MTTLRLEVDQLQLPKLDLDSPALFSTWWLPEDAELSPHSHHNFLSNLEPDEVWDVITKAP
eukprot:CAMPEP_0114554850 /NCGR_PEP_ID=MMETSP0114-20121206/8431_1 /TAXON_ID=31324 /ORGANISM="Goniomonas sp, Strain m" /LENGTH=60 /DNA_ID=CAMNT_0001739927 /DNA_START=23 /DNA_END=205 /DNA_ORIENTATION=+